MAAKKKKNVIEIERLLSESELAEISSLTVRFIKDARLKYGLPYIKLGRLVRVRLSDFESWIEQRKVG